MVRVTTHPALPEAAEPGYEMPEYKNQPCTPMCNSFPIQHEDVTQILLEMQKKSLSTAHIGAPTAFWGYAHPHASVHNLPLSFFFGLSTQCPPVLFTGPFPPKLGTAELCSPALLIWVFETAKGKLGPGWGGAESKLMMKMSPPCLCLN